MSLNRFLSLTSLVLLTTITSLGIPAKPGLQTITQSDGTVLQIEQFGDENFHYTLSSDGYLLRERDGIYYYAEPDGDMMPVASSYRAVEPGKRSAACNAFLRRAQREEMLEALYSASLETARARMAKPKRGPGKFHDSTFPTSGEQKAIVILAEFQDVKFRLDDPHAYFSDMLNKEGFSEYGGTGSARDYFIKASSGKFQPQFDVFGPVTLPNNMAWYGRNNAQGSHSEEVRMLPVHACQLLMPRWTLHNMTAMRTARLTMCLSFMPDEGRTPADRRTAYGPIHG